MQLPQCLLGNIVKNGKMFPEDDIYCAVGSLTLRVRASSLAS